MYTHHRHYTHIIDIYENEWNTHTPIICYSKGDKTNKQTKTNEKKEYEEWNKYDNNINIKLF